MLVEPDTMTDRLENVNTFTAEPGSGSAITTSDTNQTSDKVNLLALKSLEIGACGMTSASACDVAGLIRANIGITSLSLTGNKDIDADGWTEIADSLEHNIMINVLELHHNALENTCTRLIADGLARNTSIHTIDLEGNHIGDEGAQQIQKMLEVNRALRTVHLRNGNGISESTLASIEHLTAERQHASSAT